MRNRPGRLAAAEQRSANESLRCGPDGSVRYPHVRFVLKCVIADAGLVVA